MHYHGKLPGDRSLATGALHPRTPAKKRAKCSLTFTPFEGSYASVSHAVQHTLTWSPTRRDPAPA
eukprot:6200582-Pleurochrysis_carterae.AAC.1